jgi:DNA primase
MREKFSLEQLQHAGLYNEKGNLIFYQHKVIIPFIESGRVIFLQGRRTDDQQPKYMHLKRSVPLFNAEILKRLATGERVYICEGVFDAMTIEQAGYKAVAILGVNSFKPQMTELFSGRDVVLCLDNDEQGEQATQDLARVFLLQGQSVKRKLLPDGVKDITEYCIK